MICDLLGVTLSREVVGSGSCSQTEEKSPVLIRAVQVSIKAHGAGKGCAGDVLRSAVVPSDT